MKRVLKRIIVCFLSIVLMTSVAIAHSGRTDSNGGHWNRSTGTYHYHNGGSSTTSSTSTTTSRTGSTSTSTSTSTTTTRTRTTTPKPSATPQASNDITIYINGKRMAFEVPPHVFEGRTLVPLRGIFEELGYGISWDESTKTIKSIGQNREIALRVGEQYATIDGKSVALDVRVQVIKNTTFVPLRFIAESMNATVHWEASTKTITITSK